MTNMSDCTTSLERVLAAVELSKRDRVPVIPQVTYATSQLLGLKFYEPMFDASLMAKALFEGYKRFGYDGIYVGWESSFNLMAEAMGCKLRIVEDANPSIDERIVNSRKDVENIVLPYPEKDGRLPIYLEAIDLLKLTVEERVPLLSYVPGPFTLSGVLYGVDSLMLDILRNPDFIHELNTFTTLASKRFAEAKINHGVDVVVVADPTSSTSLISPDMFEEFSLPYLKEVILSINEVEAIPSIHICGKTDLILEKMADTKAKIIEVDSMIDLNEAKKRVGDKTCLMGNVDTSTLLSGNPSDVEKEVKDCIYQVGEEGGFILSSGCEVPLNTPIENIKAMVHATKAHGVY